ncbi:hypothetical protein EW146_g99 [Bondarzewia mesenterica]|uniref:Uncharacterized protein n=1 Tax=Bondarzewia mesenterica TaxID=1095465 RepID=A0A4S4M818_9AGAM|nr:hypothetical protein EW146_g99 [Bondarzewia mesenterica]
MSLYTPVFPSMPPVPPLSSSASSSNETSAQNPSSWIALLSQRHLTLASLPLELCPPSPTAINEAHVDQIRQKICGVIKAAKGETSSGRWSNVAELTKMGCTRGRWQGIVRHEAEQSSPEDREWFLAETDEEWADWEKKRAEIVKQQELMTEQEQEPEDLDPNAGLSEAQIATIKENITKWQVEVVSAPDIPSVGAQSKRSQSKANGRDPKRPSPLGFPVVKRAVATSKKRSGKETTSRYFPNSRDANIPEGPNGKVDSAPDVPRPSASAHKPPSQTPPDNPGPALDLPKAIFETSSGPQSIVRMRPIDEVPEFHYPPSFPSELPTSTPYPNMHLPKTKPPPIPRTEQPFFSSPQPPEDAEDVIEISSSSIHALKQPGSPVPPPLSSPTLSQSPMTKKHRLTHATPPASSPRSPTPEKFGSGLGNAKGLPLPTTPERKALPTLSELLASSRRSRPRPRPPSRKAQPSPAKTYFSSPASGSSSDDGPVQDRPTSPVSPLLSSFTQNGAAFAPQLVSTQLGLNVPARGLSRQGTGSGYFGMGYNSQFDVEGNVDRVSELLERDVDFVAWLRDIPPVTDEQDGAGTQEDVETEH